MDGKKLANDVGQIGRSVFDFS